MFTTLPLSSIYQDGLAVNGGTFLVSHTPCGSRVLCRERKSLLCCLQLWERKHSWMAIVAVAIHVRGFISGSIPTLNMVENALLKFLSPYISCPMHRTSKAASRSAILWDHVHSKPWLLKMIAFLTNHDSIEWLLGWARTHYYMRTEYHISGYSIGNSTQYSVITSMRKESEKEDKCITESSYCTEETNTTLQINYISIKVF